MYLHSTKAANASSSATSELKQQMEKLPEPNSKDKAISIARALVKGSAGVVPIAGTFLSEIVDLLYKQPIDQRREEWLNDLAEALNDVQNRQAELTPEKLAEDPNFITVLHRATEIAVRTHQKEKRQYLKNAIINSTKPNPPDFDKQMYFLRLIEELTVDHVLTLDLYKDPREWFARHQLTPQEFLSASREQVLLQAYPDQVNSEDFRVLVLNDLERRGLMGSITGLVSGRAVYDSLTSKIGKEFVEYITS